MRCILHQWGKWSEAYIVYGRDSCYEANVTVQERRCTRCNKLQVCMVFEGDTYNAPDVEE